MRILIAIAVAAVIGCKAPTVTETDFVSIPVVPAPSQDTAVYKALLANRQVSPLRAPFVILDRTWAEVGAASELKKGFTEQSRRGTKKKSDAPPFGATINENMWRTLVDSFRTRNKTRTPIERFDLSDGTQWVNSSDTKFASRDHKGISGVETLSAVGYSSKVDIAVVDVNIGVGPKSASETLVLLQKQGQDWRVVQTFVRMIA